ncbi:hypothetical protein [Owenweeksia hongkongensis]|uniref:hypothetical protein n=1 Tax=Owenweeksia hongkongensis TaxID=253245 RepID=UPI003A9260B9
MKKIKHPVPEKHLKAIGDIIISFALLESSLQFLIGRIINIDQRIQHVITAELSFRNLRGLLTSLYLETYSNDSKFAELKTLIIQAAKLEAERNKIVHSIWGAGENENFITRIKTTAKEKKGLNFQYEVMSIGQIEKIAEDIKIWVYGIETFRFNTREHK